MSTPVRIFPLFIENLRSAGWRLQGVCPWELLDPEAGLGDALAAALRAAARGLESAGSAVGEGEAAGEAAGLLHPQAGVAAAQAPLDVPEILFENPGRDLELAPQLLEAQLALVETVDDPLPHRLGRGRIIAFRRIAPRAQQSAPGGASRSRATRISFWIFASIRIRSNNPACSISSANRARTSRSTAPRSAPAALC